MEYFYSVSEKETELFQADTSTDLYSLGKKWTKFQILLNLMQIPFSM